MDNKLNILSIGAGAIGTYFGGSLALKDHNVVFLERPEVAQELRNGRLKLNLGGNEFEVKAPNVVDNLPDALIDVIRDLRCFAPRIIGAAATEQEHVWEERQYATLAFSKRTSPLPPPPPSSLGIRSPPSTTHLSICNGDHASPRRRGGQMLPQYPL